MKYLCLVAGIFGLDFLLKKRVEETMVKGKKEELLDGKVFLCRVQNKGAFLNLLDKNRKLLLIISGILLALITFVFMLILPKKGHGMQKAGLALILGGASSNVFDRFYRGYVVDYVGFPWPKRIYFNISDFCIFIGSIFIMFAKK